jgi:hypothetical protein
MKTKAQSATGQAPIGPGVPPPGYVPLDLETRTCVPTDIAAYHLGRRPQTMREHASTGRGPIQPLRINGRLAFPVAELRKLLGVAK